MRNCWCGDPRIDGRNVCAKHADVEDRLRTKAPNTVTLPRADLEAIQSGVVGLQQDLLERAEFCPDAGKVVCAGNGAWYRFNQALTKLEGYLNAKS